MAMVRAVGGKWITSVVSVAQSAVDTDANGRLSVTISDLRKVVAAIPLIGGGYKAEIPSDGINGNTVTVVIYQYDYPAAAAGAAVALANATDVAPLTIIAVGE